MELSSVFVLALVSFVTGTPHGYGVKSGAVARAEANAAAGAFGVPPAIPLSIPSGGGFSGSFSKSSSSSFASASSSASSSSSSFSYSGSGTNGIAGFGCQSGGCKNQGNSASTLLNSSHGNGAQSNAGAFTGTASITGSNVYLGSAENSPCTGNNCKADTPNKCTSGVCDLPSNKQDTSYDLHESNNYNTDNNCLSGKCNTVTQNENSQNGYESPKCVSGNCSPTSQEQPDKINNYDHHHGVSNTENNGKSQPPSEHDIFIPLSPSNNEPKPVHPKPTTQLFPPSQGPICTSHDCNVAPSGPDSGNGKLPTSYNVPILGTNPGTTLSVPVYNNAYPTETVYNLPTGSGSLYNCGYTGCSSDNSSPIDAKPPTLKPYSHGEHPSLLLVAPPVSPSCTGSNCKPVSVLNSNVPIKQFLPKPTTCNTPDCTYYPTSGSGVSGYPSHFDSSKPTNTGEPSYSKPIGISPNYNSAASVPHESSFMTGGYSSNTASYNIGSQQGSYNTQFDHKSKTNTPSRQNLPAYTDFTKAAGSDENVGYTPTYNSIVTSKPHFEVSSTTQSSPIYTGGFGGPAGTINTNPGKDTQFSSKPSHGETPVYDFDINTGSYNTGAHSGYTNTKLNEKSKINLPSSQHLPVYTGGFTKPAASTDGSYGHTPGLFEKSKPNLEISSTTQNTPIYTGGFGGQAGSLDTSSAIGTQFESEPNHSEPPTYNNNNLPYTTISAGKNSVFNSYTGSNGLSKPSVTLIPPTESIPKTPGPYYAGPTNIFQTGLANTALPIAEKKKSSAYIGGFGGPKGILSPNEYNLPTRSPAERSKSYSPTNCSSGSCKSKNTPNVIGADQGTNLPTTLSASADAKAEAYSGGFGGPSGFLKPFESDKHSKHGQYEFGAKDLSSNEDFTNSGITAPSKSSGGSSDGTNTGLQINHGRQSHGEAQANAGARTIAAATATSSAFGVNQGLGSSGCNSGCGGNYNLGSGNNFASSSSQGVSHTGLDETQTGISSTSAAAKSVAGASAGVFGTGKSFASSSAHSSAGASVKGGYGR